MLANKNASKERDCEKWGQDEEKDDVRKQQKIFRKLPQIKSIDFCAYTFRRFSRIFFILFFFLHSALWSLDVFHSYNLYALSGYIKPGRNGKWTERKRQTKEPRDGQTEIVVAEAYRGSKTGRKSLQNQRRIFVANNDDADA